MALTCRISMCTCIRMNPEKRFILVDLQKFREGETLGSGAVLEEILPGSIQLYYQGTRFRMEK